MKAEDEGLALWVLWAMLCGWFWRMNSKSRTSSVLAPRRLLRPPEHGASALNAPPTPFWSQPLVTRCACTPPPAGDGSIRIYDIYSGALTKLLRLHSRPLTALAHVAHGEWDLLIRWAGRAEAGSLYLLAPFWLLVGQLDGRRAGLATHWSHNLGVFQQGRGEYNAAAGAGMQRQPPYH